MAQQQRAMDTRNNALRGAARVIDRRGYKAATITEMIQESGITKGALYFHFPSKEAIAEAIIAEQGEWLSQRHEPDAPPIQTIVDLSYEFVDALLSDPLMRASVRMTLDRAVAHDSVVRGYTSWITAVTELLQRARATDTLCEDVHPNDCAYTITSAMTGLQVTSDALSRRADLATRVEHFWRLLLPAIVRPHLVSKVDFRPPQQRPSSSSAAITETCDFDSP